MPFGVFEGENFLAIRDDLFLETNNLLETTDVFYLSFQPGIKEQLKITPIIRTGTISLINEDKTFYIDGHAFPGNSGSPVFFKSSNITQSSRTTMDLVPESGSLLGVISSYIPYQDVAISQQTGEPRVIFEENTGLSIVFSISYVKEILDSAPYKEQLKRAGLINGRSGQI